MRSTSLWIGLAAILAAGTPMASAVEVRSLSHRGVKVNFKETKICETTAGVKGYSGYVTLPVSERQPYETNIFFWFFEARNSPKTAPLSVWVQGGPGAGSTDQAVSGHNGPCVVNPDSKTTALNPHSWNEAANMLYIDQPSQTGFSYDTVVDGLYDLEAGTVKVTTASPNSTLFVKGKFPSQNPANTANSTQTAAHAIYHFLQAWFDEFDQYKRDSISIWSQSYGGHYVPAIASVINREFKSPGSVVKTGTCRPAKPPHRFRVESAGIINGMVDLYTQLPWFNEYAFKNPYGIAIYDEAQYREYNATVYGPGGCLDSARACRDLLAKNDPDGLVPPSLFADDAFLGACGATSKLCGEGLVFRFMPAHQRYHFDIAQKAPLTFPRAYALGWLNRPEVQAALGVRTTYIANSETVTNVFDQAVDMVRSAFIGDLGELVDDGVKVALIYGDRDYRCNWLGGEAVSLGVKYKRSSDFAAAGYADLTVGGSVVGKVRQQGLFSFSRIYNAGHEVPHYKRAESLEIFKRTLLGRDLATGQVDAHSADYRTTGPSQVADVKVPLEPPTGSPECYTWESPLSLYCSEEQIQALGNGTAVVRDFIVTQPTA